VINAKSIYLPTGTFAPFSLIRFQRHDHRRKPADDSVSMNGATMNRLLGTGAAAAALALTLAAGSPTSSAGDSQGTATWSVDAAHS
jgi:hypothetical protein